MLVKIIVVLVVILACVLFFIVRIADAQEDKAFKDEYPGPIFNLANGKLFFDLEHNRIMFSSDDGRYYKNIKGDNMFNVRSSEIINEESRNGHPISRAVVGGLLAGGVGAIVGAVSGVGTKAKIYLRLEYSFETYLNDGDGGDDYIKTIQLLVVRGVSDPNNIRQQYNKFNKIGDLLQSNLGVAIQRVD